MAEATTQLGEELAPNAEELLAVEARTVLRFLIGSSAGPDLVRRYVVAATRYSVAPIGLPAIVHRHPWIIRVLEPPLKPRAHNQLLLRQRLDMAMVLCEASPHGQRLLWRDERKSRLAVLAELSGELALDAVTMPFRLIASLVWK